jgi:hypothetical protein
LKTGRQLLAAFQKGVIKIRGRCPPVGRKDEREQCIYSLSPKSLANSKPFGVKGTGT